MYEQRFKQVFKDAAAEIVQELREFRGEFREFREETKSEMDEIKKEMGQHKSEMKGMKERATAVEERVNCAEERETILVEVMETLTQDMDEMQKRVEYLENKSRQMNVRIYNVKENNDPANMRNFVETLLHETLQIPKERLGIVAAHRSGATKKADASWNKPRSIIARFPTWEAKQQVLKAAWGKKEVLYRGERIYLDQDFTAKLQTQRKGFMRIRSHLKEKGIKAHVRYPAKLFVLEENGTRIFNTPQDSEQAYGLTPSARPKDRGEWVHQLKLLGWERVRNGSEG
uniref:L1 transposable element RRM domain-containing protein n=1 Tax=Knipowitschia caucasica TaxID=637954 RepID=A0AAV2J264_KNICA